MTLGWVGSLPASAFVMSESDPEKWLSGKWLSILRSACNAFLDDPTRTNTWVHHEYTDNLLIEVRVSRRNTKGG